MKKRKTREEKVREITEKAEKLIRKKIDLSTKFDFDNVIEFKDAENCQKMMKILKEIKPDDKFKWEVFRDDTHRFEMVRDEQNKGLINGSDTSDSFTDSIFNINILQAKMKSVILALIILIIMLMVVYL